MKHFLLSWLISFILIIILDMLWFSYSVEKFYKIYLNDIISFDINKKAALMFYFLYSFAIVYLCNDFKSGLVLGMAAYSAYNFTNFATMPNWPTVVLIVDTIWGSFVTGAVAYFVRLVVQ
jgi:uncharacterized membrane protein